MHEKKTVMQKESTQDDTLLAFFFSRLFRETLTFCILALKQNYTAKTTQTISKNYTGTQMDEVIMQIIARPFGLL